MCKVLRLTSDTQKVPYTFLLDREKTIALHIEVSQRVSSQCGS